MVAAGPETTIIDGGQTGSVVEFVSNEDRSSRLEGFTLTNGSGKAFTLLDDPEPFKFVGGGVYIENASPTIADCIIANNSATYGGGKAIESASPLIIDCTIVNNSASEFKFRVVEVNSKGIS